MIGKQDDPSGGSPHILFPYLAMGWGSRASGPTALAVGDRCTASQETSTVPISASMCSLREVLILAQLAGWHPLPVLQTWAAFLSCYLTPLSACGIQEHIGLLGKTMFYKSKCVQPELTVTLAATHTMKPRTVFMASGVQGRGTSSGSQDNQGVSELVTQTVQGRSSDKVRPLTNAKGFHLQDVVLPMYQTSHLLAE